MTKLQEIKRLKAIIKEFGPNSYIGPWLKKLEADIQWAIVNDYDIDAVIIHVTKVLRG